MKSFIISAVMGVAALFLVNFFSSYTVISFGVNPLSIGTAVVLGLPGVITALVLKLFV